MLNPLFHDSYSKGGKGYFGVKKKEKHCKSIDIETVESADTEKFTTEPNK